MYCLNVSVLCLDVVDPNRDGQVSLQEYMAFMISKETENVHSSEEIENAFRAITAHQDRAYVTKDELYAVSNLTSSIIFHTYTNYNPHPTNRIIICHTIIILRHCVLLYPCWSPAISILYMLVAPFILPGHLYLNIPSL